MTPRALWEKTVNAGGNVLVRTGRQTARSHLRREVIWPTGGGTRQSDGTVHLAPEEFVARLRQLISMPAIT